jgi:hypothetical protein
MKNSPYLSLFASYILFASFNVQASIAGSCNNTAGGFCNEFTGSAYKTEKVQKSCQRQNMTFLAGSCPSTKQVGTCIVYQGKNSESQYHYYNNFPGYGIKPKEGVAGAAERQCGKLKGAWSPN